MAKELQPFQQRVVDEKRELDEKIAKLEAFMRGVTDLPVDECMRMISQRNAMREYSNILGQRIAAFV